MSAGGKADHLWPPTGKYKEEGEKSLLEAAKTLACARAWHEGGGSHSQRHCRMRECQATG